MKRYVNIKRTTKESVINVSIDTAGISPNYKENINTNIPFFNHMIEHIAYRWGVDLKVDIKLDKFDLTHVVFEDIGMAIGKAVKAYMEENLTEGMKGYGFSVGIIDEANSQIAISFENRAYFSINSEVDVPTVTENTLSEDLETFFEGFCQGAMCSLQIDIKKGRNAHHIWEATYRAFGQVLRDALSIDESRKNLTAGVCGTIQYETIVK